MKYFPVLFFISICSSVFLQAEVSLPPVFGDHAVLQHGVPVTIWGQAAAGEKISVSYLGQKKEALADANGKWSLSLDAMAPSLSGDLVIAGSNILTLKDVVTGEVWVCSGQSNMEWRIRSSSTGKKEAETATHPDIRMFKSPFQTKEGTTEGGTWQPCSPETVGDFSAAGYFFAKNLNENLKVPVGMLSASVGGTPIEAWTKGGGLYRSRVMPFIPYTIRGAIWYQGEANARPSPAISASYEGKLTKLIEGWRADWGYDFPFAWVQLPNYKKRQEVPVEELSLWAPMREAMLKTLKVPHTGMAVAIDLGGGENAPLHPADKTEVGKRLALWALSKVYEVKETVGEGPVATDHEIKGSEIVVSFDHADGGLVAKGDSLKSFAITGENHVWAWADARIEGKTVILSNSQIPKPIAVRYAWAENPVASLYNGAGLPASPFRTDDFPLSSEDQTPPPKPSPAPTPTASAAPVTTP